MNYKELKAILQEHGPTAVIVAVAVASTVAIVCSMHYKERISVLETQVAWLEKRLKDSYLPSAPAPTPSTNQSSPASAPIVSTQPTGLQRPDTRLPSIANPKLLTKLEVKSLASFYGLLQEWPMNPHLRFLDGDISYWAEQNLSEERLKAEFEARRQVLERAEANRQRIPTQGDLSARATQIVPLLLQK